MRRWLAGVGVGESAAQTAWCKCESSLYVPYLSLPALVAFSHAASESSDS